MSTCAALLCSRRNATFVTSESAFCKERKTKRSKKGHKHYLLCRFRVRLSDSYFSLNFILIIPPVVMLDPEEEQYGLEMESLMQETAGGNEIPRIKTIPTSPRSNRKSIVVFVLCIIAAVWFLKPAKLDKNNLVTDIDKLPEAINVEENIEPTDDDEHHIQVPEAPDQDPLIVVVDPSEDEISKEHSNVNVPIQIDIMHPEEKGFQHPPPYFSSAYVRRARHDRTNLPDLAEKWGAWTLEDVHPRPNLEPLYAQYPNRDVPMKDFPSNAWQADMEYLPKFIDQGIALTERALEAILAEYGHFERGVTHLEDALADMTKDDPAFMFNMSILPGFQYNRKHPIGNAGRTTESTIQRVRKQLLHSIVTEDKFFLTMGGHSSSAGHGNHFTQSYIMQVQRALEPILARLGVYHISRNVGMGGLGTIHNGIASRSFYGGDNAILVWNSGM